MKLDAFFNFEVKEDVAPHEYDFAACKDVKMTV